MHRLLLAIIVLMFGVSLRAAEPWQIVESENFRLVSRDAAAERGALLEDFERARKSLFTYWLNDDAPTAWSAKCEIVLHPTDAGYFSALGVADSDTVASALVDHLDGKITVRRVDVRATCADWATSAFPHELTHVILGERFAGKALPRWADEGMAILADPAEVQAEHYEQLAAAVDEGHAMRLVEFVNLIDYPQPEAWGAFYGQSASLVRFLVRKQSPTKFIDFIESGLANGNEAALAEVYGLKTAAACENAWRAGLGDEARIITAAQCGPKLAALANPKQ